MKIKTETLYLVNVGTKENFKVNRSWFANRRYGFISAGQGVKYRNQIRRLKQGDIICAYVNGKGYVGIGRVKEEAVPILFFKTNEGEELKNYVNPVLYTNSNDMEKCEWTAKIDWLVTDMPPLFRDKEKDNFFYTRNTVAEIKNKKAVELIEDHFDVNFVK